MSHLRSQIWTIDFPRFTDQRVNFLKNRKIKNATGFLILFKVIKKTQNFQKQWFVLVFWWFSRPLGKAIRYKSLFWNCLLTGGKCRENRNHSWFFVRRPWILIPDNMKNTFLIFFSLLKFVTRYCFNSSDEKTLKIN